MAWSRRNGPKLGPTIDIQLERMATVSGNDDHVTVINKTFDDVK